MPINNPGLYDAVLAAIAASNEAMLIDPIPTDYLVPANIAVAVAVEVDAAIPPDVSMSTSKRILLEGITKSVFAGRCPQSTTSSDHLATSAAIAAMYTEFVTKLQDGSGGGGGGINLTRMLYVDQATTTPIASRNGNIESPFSSIAAAIAASTANTMIYVMPYDYSAEGAQAITHTMAIATNVFVEDAELSNLLPHATYSDFTVTGAGTNFQLEGAVVNNLIADPATVVIANQVSCLTILGHGILQLDTVAVDNTGIIQCSTLKTKNCQIPIAVTIFLTALPAAQICQIRQSKLNGTVITFDAAATNAVAQIDNDTLHSIGSGLGNIVNGTIYILDEIVLSDILFVDSGTPTAAASQNGSIGNPFSTITAAIAKSGSTPTVIFVTPGGYNAEGTISVGNAVSVIGYGGQYSVLAFSVVAGFALTAENCSCTNAIVVPATSSFFGTNVSLTGGITGNGNVVLDGGSVPNSVACSGFTATRQGLVENVTISGTQCVIYESGFGPPSTITFSGAAGVVDFDGISYDNFLASGSTIVNGTIRIRNATRRLSNVAYVDSLMTTADQNGSITNPYDTITAASSVLAPLPVPVVIYITPDDYTAEATIVLGALTSQEFVSLRDDTNVLLPAINSTGNVTIKGCTSSSAVAHTIAVAFTAIDSVLHNCTVVNLNAETCTFDGTITITDPTGTVRIHDSNVNTATSAVWLTIDAGVTIVITDTIITPDGGPTAINFTSGVGTIQMDAFTYGQWLNSASTTNGTIRVIDDIPKLNGDLDGNGHAIFNFHNGGSTVNLAVGAGATVAFPADTIGGLGANKIYNVTYGFRCGLVKDADHHVNGEIDFQVGASVATNGASVATVTFATVPVPNVSYLPAGLAGATFTVAASAGGFTVSVTAPGAVACHAWFEFWLQRYRDVT